MENIKIVWEQIEKEGRALGLDENVLYLAGEEDGYFDTYIICRTCGLGDNFYDYGEKPPRHLHFETQEILEFYLKWKKYLVLIDCTECCGCAGW